MPPNKNLYNTTYLPNLETYKKIKEKNPFITKESTQDHWDEFVEYLTDEICFNRNGVDLTMSLGWLFMGAFPSKDNEFKEHRRKCELLGGMEHFRIQERDGFECRIVYTHTKSKKRAYSPTFFGFRPVGPFRSKCTDFFKKDWKKYVVIPNIRFMDGIVRALEKIRKVRTSKLEKHNEFED